jgi:hypothetical protein
MQNPRNPTAALQALGNRELKASDAHPAWRSLPPDGALALANTYDLTSSPMINLLNLSAMKQKRNFGISALAK